MREYAEGNLVRGEKKRVIPPCRARALHCLAKAGVEAWEKRYSKRVLELSVPGYNFVVAPTGRMQYSGEFTGSLDLHNMSDILCAFQDERTARPIRFFIRSMIKR